MKMLAKAIALAATAFEHRVDKAGQPYILHCLFVMEGVKHRDEEVQCAAILHDLIEDCGDKYTFEGLIQMGFSHRVVHLLTILTHDKNVSTYEDYIKQIALNPDATEIKKRDLEHNSTITRLKGLRKKDFDRIEKYHKAYVYLTGL